ncbi:apolipoprotein N-acyltransferase [Hymenobacter sp. UYP22]
MILTLLLSESTPLSLAGFLLLAPLILVLSYPLFWLARSKASTAAKTTALVLASLLIWLGSELSADLGAGVTLFSCIPFGLVVFNLSRGTAEEK